MSQRLDVNSGETYTIGSGETEEWLGADVDGTLEVNGTLKLIDNPDIPDEDEGFDVGTNPLDLPLGLDLPTRPINLTNMQTGIAIFLMGTLSLLMAGAAVLKNYLAGVLWSFAVFSLLASGLFGIGLELFWVLVIATAFSLAAGMVVRWSQ